MEFRNFQGWRDSIPIAAILGGTYRVPLSPLSGTSPQWQIGVDERSARVCLMERNGTVGGREIQEIQDRRFRTKLPPTHHQKCPEREMLFIT
jgi:hypothetical protein